MCVPGCNAAFRGKRTGLFISPHLVKMNERIMIDGVPVSDEVFSEVFTQTLGAVKQMEAEGLEHPTFLNFCLEWECWHFPRQKLSM